MAKVREMSGNFRFRGRVEKLGYKRIKENGKVAIVVSSIWLISKALSLLLSLRKALIIMSLSGI